MRERQRQYNDMTDAFSDLLGHALNVAQTWLYVAEVSGNPNGLEQARRLKGVFYRRVRKLRKLGFPDQGMITLKSLEGFGRFRRCDWGDKEIVEKVIDYYHTIIPNGNEMIKTDLV